MAQRVREVRTEDRNSPLARHRRTSFMDPSCVRHNGTITLEGVEPRRPQEDTIEWHTAQKQPRRNPIAQPQMMPLEPLVVREDLVRSRTPRRTPQSRIPLVLREQHGCQPNALALEDAWEL